MLVQGSPSPALVTCIQHPCKYTRRIIAFSQRNYGRFTCQPGLTFTYMAFPHKPYVYCIPIAVSAKTTKSIFCNTLHYFKNFFIFNIRSLFSAKTLPNPNLHSTHRSPTINFFTLLGRSLKLFHSANPVPL